MVRGDARALPFATGSVQCVVTSPPYWGLRDYGTATWVGGDAACSHAKVLDHAAAVATSTLGGGKKSTGHIQEGFKAHCGRCGAARVDAQLGLEATPDAYVAGMVAVFRQVWRVLRDDGTLFLNLGDSYASDTKGSGGPTPKQASNVGSFYEPRKLAHGLKPKDLVGIPWRVAFALQADGWYLRSDIIWSKANPMPESVTDRPTKAHEYVFLLTKAERYYWNAEAVKEPASDTGGTVRFSSRRAVGGLSIAATGNEGRASVEQDARKESRNIRSVWSIATQPYAGAHFATMPEKLVERCVLAGSRQGDVVLDPFLGSGTVARVATSLGRKGFGCELNRDYLRLARVRTHVTYGLPLEWEPAV